VAVAEGVAEGEHEGGFAGSDRAGGRRVVSMRCT
jgi:hypothetical protein